MTIEYLKVIYKDNKYIYNFSAAVSLIYSKENSKGKTTLLRFLLYALGYQIPATEGIGDFERLEFELSFTRDNKKYILVRKGDEIKVSLNGTSSIYILPVQENELHSVLFGISDLSIIKNLLSVYYIDQEKGWTMLNRGKIIGNIRFNIEEFIAGVSNIDIESLLDEKATISNELKKYRYFKNVVDINSEYEDVDDVSSYDNHSLDELLQQQKELELELSKTKQKRKMISDIISGNKKFANLLVDLGIVIIHNEEEFVLSENDLSGFNNNQELLKMKESMFKVEEEKIHIELNRIAKIINEKNRLFSLDSVVQELEKSVESMNIDINSVDKIITQLNNRRKKVNTQIKNKLSFNNNQLCDFYDNINKYAIELGIKQYISNDSPKFVLTNKLKGFSGRVLAQMAYIFKLSYIKIIEKNYELVLPIIIDSPRTNELSVSSTNDMLNILKRDFSNHQVILASIYKYDVINYKTINMDNGLFDVQYLDKK